jgi:hypothetical protein|tara:strand:- start:72 stop:254 length:183 start_codon:yes stop_codon:yes gene_type:complete
MKKVTITSKNISIKQWTNLLLELNLMKKAWKPFAPLDIQATNLKKIIAWGTKKYDVLDKE